MDQEKLLKRINELANKKKKNGLTESEIQEQKKIRQEYLLEFRKGFKNQLDNTVFLKELVIDKNKITEDGLDKLKSDDAVVKIENKGDKYEIYYDVKGIDEKTIIKLISK